MTISIPGTWSSPNAPPPTKMAVTAAASPVRCFTVPSHFESGTTPARKRRAVVNSRYPKPNSQLVGPNLRPGAERAPRPGRASAPEPARSASSDRLIPIRHYSARCYAKVNGVGRACRTIFVGLSFPWWVPPRCQSCKEHQARITYVGRPRTCFFLHHKSMVYALFHARRSLAGFLERLLCSYSGCRWPTA